jgi:AraC-like DNA-binding protein
MHETMPNLPWVFVLLFLMTAIQGIILSVVLWKHKSNRVQNRLLGWLLFVYAFIFLYFIITNTSAYYFHPMYPGATASWIMGTITINLLLMYLRACFGLRPSPPHAAWYWLPTAFFVLLTIARYIIGPQVVAHFLVIGWIGLAYITGITILCYYKFREYASRSDSAPASHKTKRYLSLILFFFALYSISQIFGFALYPYIPQRASLYISISVKLFTAVGVYAIAYLNVQNAHQVAPVMMAYPEPAEKYKFSSLDDDTANYIQHRLQKLVETEKIFLQRDLRLKDVADKLGASVHHVSQVLNERLQLSFNDFVNKLRVEEARKMLATGDDSKIESIALDTGFNNKVSFNKAFKKFTGVTPSQYKAGQEGEVTG